MCASQEQVWQEETERFAMDLRLQMRMLEGPVQGLQGVWAVAKVPQRQSWLERVGQGVRSVEMDQPLPARSISSCPPHPQRHHPFDPTLTIVALIVRLIR